MLSYPICEVLNSDEKRTCQNPDLRAEAEFYIDKIHNGCAFVAYIQPEGEAEAAPPFYMSQLNAQVGGICDDVATKPGYRKCGLAKYLMKACFEDEHILGGNRRGFDVRKDYPGIPNYWVKERRARRVHEYCKTVTFTACQVDDKDTTLYACVAYIRAARLAQFDILFSFKSHSLSPAKGIKLIDAEIMFTYDKADQFIEQNGEVWFFCKCFGTMKSMCMSLIDYVE